MPAPSTSAPQRALAFSALAVVAPALGGSTDLWARGILLVATAALLITSPPRRGPGQLWTALAAALIAAAGIAFLPASWLPLPHWRRLLTDTFEVDLPDTLSPQPWLSLEGA